MSGFVPKTISATKLADAIRTVHDGERYIDPALAADAIAAGDSPCPRAKPTSWLWQRMVPCHRDRTTLALLRDCAQLSVFSADQAWCRNRHEAVHTARSHGWV